ncbi:MAG TPA: 4-hydroxy-2-oxovalerate aldolase [Candidatus Dormibacteraeota bacterium]|nr:4-hydroxy-2-oxovalerate aldolase [Candidatus Dormibacteraeota bacterium]
MSNFDITPDILEVTLRDGSYLIDFQFTAEDTATIAAALEGIGFRWIEVGHGLGLNASNAGKGTAAATDEEYLEAAAQALKHARWGMFFIPGIGREEDLRLAARYGMSFVRIGTNVTETAQAEPYIALAKELGFIVSYNAMKSYAVSPAEFGKSVAKVHTWGADIACLVDSAGSMDPDSVAAYLRAARAESPSPLGYHGHDNLSLAMANTLRAIEEGAVLVDSSLQGMGRSAGNTVTEVLVAILQRRGALAHIDLKAAMDVGQGLIQPLLGKRGVDPMAVTGGLAKFHSSFTGKVQTYARKHDIDVRDLIVRLCQEDQVSAPDELLERLSHELATMKMPRVLSIPAFRVEAGKDQTPAESLELLLRELRARAVKSGKFSALNVVTGSKPLQNILVSGNIHSTQSHVVGSVEFTDEEQLNSVLNAVDGKIDVVLLDVDRKPFGPANAAQTARTQLKKTALLTYLDSRVWVEAVEDQVVRLLQELLKDSKIVIAGDHPRSRFLALRFAERGARVTVLRDLDEAHNASIDPLGSLSLVGRDLNLAWVDADSENAASAISGANVLVAWPAGKPWFSEQMAHHLPRKAYVVDAGIGAILSEAIAEAQRRDCLLLRVNIWPALTGTLSAAHESLLETSNSLGWETLDGVAVVAGGAMGHTGDVIVDSVHHPTRVIGVCDGQGGVRFRFNEAETERVRRVQAEINRRLVTPQLTSTAS